MQSPDLLHGLLNRTVFAFNDRIYIVGHTIDLKVQYHCRTTIHCDFTNQSAVAKSLPKLFESLLDQSSIKVGHWQPFMSEVDCMRIILPKSRTRFRRAEQP